METLKAGCILINKENKTVGLVYREKQNDFSFPKGHLEKNETLKECAIRETAEETKREAEIIDEIKPYIEEYTTSSGENCKCYLYVAYDKGKSLNKCTDTHDTYWIPFDEVREKLTYPDLKKVWDDVKDKINM